MINRILIELYDEYEKENYESIVEFANKTFPNDGTNKLFIGCALILFSRSNGFKPRYDATRENLLDIVASAKEKVGNTNLLAFYIERVNTHKGITKYLNDCVNSEDLEKQADIIIDYLEQFKPKFIEELKQNKNLNDFISSKE